MSRVLVTTADERTWPANQPVLFLGEWCKIYRKRKVWENLDFQVVAPYGLEPEIKKKDHQLLVSRSVQLLKELTGALNLFHGVNKSERYWNIVLGHWLQRYVSVCINRYHCLEKAFREHEISETRVLDIPGYQLTTPDSYSFQLALYDHVWNHHFYRRILDFWSVKQQVLLKADGPDHFGEYKVVQAGVHVRETIRNLWSKLFQRFSKNTDALIINTYLPFKFNIKLQLMLGQFPGFWSRPALNPAQPDASKRQNLKINTDGYSGFDAFIRKLLPEVIPTCYLEGYNEILSYNNKLHWPSRPKFIFTSNNFDTDEAFKIYTAEKVEEGTPYYAGQHGNLYGTWEYHTPEIPEMAASDRFISWGWTDNEFNTTGAFIFKTIGHKVRTKAVPDGDLILIERPIYNRLATYDRHLNQEIYQNEQFRFVRQLETPVRKKLNIRLSYYPLGEWDDKLRWNDFDPDLNYDNGLTPLWKLIDRSRLVVHSYDSTGILETLSLNIPTIAFFHQFYFDEIIPKARPYFQMLEEAGILFRTADDAATAINQNWNNLESWWSSDKVQQARVTFCSVYAKRVDHPIKTLKSILQGKSN